MLHRVKKVEYLDGYKLKLIFSDRKEKVIDFTSYKSNDKNSVFYLFNNFEFFKSVKLDTQLATLVWPNEIVVCPDTLYREGKQIKKILKKRVAKGKNSPHTSSEKPQTRIAAKSKYS